MILKKVSIDQLNYLKSVILSKKTEDHRPINHYETVSQASSVNLLNHNKKMMNAD